MARRTYTDDDRGRVFTLLAVNDGNVDRASRESGVPRATVLAWKRKWEKEGAPTDVMDAAVNTAGDFIAEARDVRFKAIQALKDKLDKASPRDLATIVGILDDKISRADAIASGRDRQVEHLHVHALPEPEQLGEILGSYLNKALSAARRRDAVVIEAPEEPGEVLALPPGRD